MLMACLSLALGKLSSQTSTLAKYFLMIGTRDKRTCTNFGFKRKEIPSDGFLCIFSVLISYHFYWQWFSI